MPDITIHGAPRHSDRETKSVSLQWENYISVDAMSHQNRDLLDILRFELKFLEDGGYANSSHAPWRASYIFEDSPSCLNFKQSTRPHPCSECLLTKLVPIELRDHDVPCRFIPLDDKGHTVDSLYRTGTQDEMVEALKIWLRREIRKLEDEPGRAGTSKRS